jgi:hypothetical protein
MRPVDARGARRPKSGDGIAGVESVMTGSTAKANPITIAGTRMCTSTKKKDYDYDYDNDCDCDNDYRAMAKRGITSPSGPSVPV